MIDFRYHIVSLISVFLALAVGIALGAGPLKETIGDTLTGQVEQLRGEKDALRAELDTTTGALQDAETYIDAAGPQLLDGSLTDRRVAVIALGEVDESTRTAIDERLAESGASVTAHVTLTETWADPDARTFRQALVGQLLTYLDPVPADDAGVEGELASALVQALVTSDPSNPDVLSDDASVLLRAPVVERERQPAGDRGGPGHRARRRDRRPRRAARGAGRGRDAQPRCPSRVRRGPARRAERRAGAVVGRRARRRTPRRGQPHRRRARRPGPGRDPDHRLGHRASSPARSTCRSRWRAGSPAPTGTTASATTRPRCRPPWSFRRSTARRGCPRARATTAGTEG